jgi:hypothetical protein
VQLDQLRIENDRIVMSGATKVSLEGMASIDTPMRDHVVEGGDDPSIFA